MATPTMYNFTSVSSLATWTTSTTRRDRQHRSVQFLTIFCYQSDQMWCSLPNIWTVSKPQCASLLLNLWPNTFVFHYFWSIIYYNSSWWFSCTWSNHWSVTSSRISRDISFIFHLLMPCGHFWALELFISIQDRLQLAHCCPFSLWERETFQKAQRTQRIKYFDSFNTFIPKQKLQQALKSWSNFSLVCLAKSDWKMHTTLTNPRSNSNKSM